MGEMREEEKREGEKRRDQGKVKNQEAKEYIKRTKRCRRVHGWLKWLGYITKSFRGRAAPSLDWRVGGGRGWVCQSYM